MRDSLLLSIVKTCFFHILPRAVMLILNLFITESTEHPLPRGERLYLSILLIDLFLFMLRVNIILQNLPRIETHFFIIIILLLLSKCIFFFFILLAVELRCFESF